MASDARSNHEAAAVDVVYATSDDQVMIRVPLEAGMTAEEAVKRSGVLARFPDIQARPLVLGIFGRAVPLSQALVAGDRIEVCRPLRQDPRDMRRMAAADGVTLGRRSS